MQSRSARWFSPLLLGLALGSLACASQPLPIQMRGLQLRSVRPDFGAGSVEMALDLRFRLRNPTSTALPILSHAAGFELEGHSVGTVQALFPPDLELPGDGSVDLIYRIAIDTGLLTPSQRQLLLGRDVAYRFTAQVELPLPPEAQNAFAALGLDSSVDLAFEDTLRVPLLPQAQLADAPSLQLVGGSLQVVERDLDMGILEDLRSAFGTTVLGLTGDPDARDAWLAFFDTVVDTDQQLVQMTPVTGMKMRVPIQITNPNQFEIQLPSLAVDFDAGARDVWSVTQTPASGTLAETGQAGSAKNVTYESTFRFDGLGALAVPATDRKLEVDTTVDLGHGSIELPIRLP